MSYIDIDDEGISMAKLQAIFANPWENCYEVDGGHCPRKEVGDSKTHKLTDRTIL